MNRSSAATQNCAVRQHRHAFQLKGAPASSVIRPLSRRYSVHQCGAVTRSEAREVYLLTIRGYLKLIARRLNVPQNL